MITGINTRFLKQFRQLIGIDFNVDDLDGYCVRLIQKFPFFDLHDQTEPFTGTGIAKNTGMINIRKRVFG